ncbi:MAG TPA: cytochrome c, partial [Burkholderiales bacterium]|nr:cytochrome c [Burkholderiales bacterium]
MKRTLVAAVAAVSALVAADALAQVKPEILVKQRQAAMTLQGKYFGPLAAMAQGKAPYNAGVVQRNA